LIEAMFASIVLAFCVVGISGLLVSAMQNQKAAIERSEAASAAAQSMEALAARQLSEYSSQVGVAQSEQIDQSDLHASGSRGRIRYIRRTTGHQAVRDRDLAIIEVSSETSDGHTVTFYRLATRAEMP
jgi:Tfp pilus assembly protein PilV